MPTGRASPLPTLPGTRQRPATTARPRQIDLFAEDTGKTAADLARVAGGGTRPPDHPDGAIDPGSRAPGRRGPVEGGQ